MSPKKINLKIPKAMPEIICLWRWVKIDLFLKKKIQNNSENVSHKLLPAGVNNLDMILF